MIKMLLIAAAEIVCIFAAVIDFRDKKVPRWIWIPAICFAAAAGLYKRKIGVEDIIILGVYWGLQVKLFSRFYGMADCRAFFVYAIIFKAIGVLTFELLMDCFMHMTIAFIILIFIQGFKKNIDRFRLKNEVAFIPYICASHFICLFFFLFS